MHHVFLHIFNSADRMLSLVRNMGRNNSIAILHCVRIAKEIGVIQIGDVGLKGGCVISRVLLFSAMSTKIFIFYSDC